ncbi:thiopeptide-type bacteriocin biosynthesis protein [Chitinophaga sp. OAE865]
MPKPQKIVILPAAIFRIPQFPMDASLESCWPELKRSIGESSATFHDIIKDLNYEDLFHQPEKVQISIAKYFNRARFRPVPYGKFAAVGMVQTGNESLPIRIKDETICHTFFDWSQIEELQYEFCDVENTNARVWANSTWYEAGQNIRYVHQSNDGSHQILELARSEQLINILKKCRQPIPFQLLMDQLAPLTLDVATTKGFLEEMISAKLLLTELDKNIIGPDYFKRRSMCSTGQVQKQYILCERQLESGYLDTRPLKHLPGLVSLLQQLYSKPVYPQLETFVNLFRAKFDQREVPLMVALDPELGVGYGNTIRNSEGDDAIFDIIGARTRQEASQEQFKRIFVEQLELNLQVLRLQNLRLSANKDILPLPNTLSALFTQCGNNIIVDHIGGTTGTALAGRFTKIGASIREHCRNMAALEQAANPGVLFFDIGYTAEQKVDNVNRREAIYDLQLNILNFDTTEEPLTADDILVSLRHNSIVLRSASRGKRLIPRHASAYNYTRSDLALFRFLCDLSHQGIQTNLIPDIRTTYPGLNYYPRMEYENIIVSPATLLVEASAFNAPAEIRIYLQKHKMEGYVKVGSGDQKLVLNTAATADLDLLYLQIQKAGRLWLEEAFINEMGMGSVQDSSGHNFFSQFLITLYHKNPIYSPSDAAPQTSGIERCFCPGTQWLYFQIYISTNKADHLITNYINRFLQNNGALIKKWFFIRYNEGGDHIRLRLQLKSSEQIDGMMARLQDLLLPELEAGTITDIQVRTYQRELERYGPEYIEQIETHFYKDSLYVFTLLRHALSDDQKCLLSVQLMRDLQQAGVFSPDHYLEFIKNRYESFRAEFGIGAEASKKIAARYDVFSSQGDFSLSEKIALSLHAFKGSLIEALQKRFLHERKQLLADLLHMHVNRLFAENQRAHEMLLYYFLIRDWYKQRNSKELNHEPLQARG